MTMKNELSKNDTVFCVKRGPGTIHSLDGNSLNIRFGSKVIAYSAETLAEYPSQERTLFWHNPFIIAPPRDSAEWNRKKAVLVAVLEALK